MDSNNFKKIGDSTEHIKAYCREIYRPFTECVKAVSQIKEQFTNNINEIVNQSRLIISQGIGKYLSEINKIIKDGAERYKIAEEKAATILEKYKWLVSPSLPMPIVFELMEIAIKPGRQDKAINKLFIDYFSLDNWRNLEMMAIEWKGRIMKERLDIIIDCIYVLQETKPRKINQTNVVLPAIIAQIDGVWEDYLQSKGITYNNSKDRKDKYNKVKVIAFPDKLDDIADSIFLDILFQRSLKARKLETPFNFNRHKILHGENLRYGRKTYLIRAFLILDFLAHLG